MPSLPRPSFLTEPRQLVSPVRAAPPCRLSLAALFHARIVGGGAWSPDGSQVVFVANISGRLNLWTVSASGGWPFQLTFSDQRQGSPAWSPDGRSIAFVSDHDGDEQWDLFLVSTENGEVVNLTRTPEVSEEGPAWSPDARWLAYIAKPRTGSSYEIELRAPATGEVRRVTRDTPRECGNFGPLWSPDGGRLAFTRQHATGRNADIYLADLASNEQRCLTPHAGEAVYQVASWSPDGTQLLIESNALNGYDNVALLDLASGHIEWLTEEAWEVSAGDCSRDGRWLSWQANLDGETGIYLYERASRRLQRLALPAGVNVLEGAECSFAPDSTRLLFAHNGPESANELWSYALADGCGAQVTHARVAGLRAADLVTPQRAHYPSRDGRWQISAWVYAPPNRERDGSHPAVVYVHGGPAAQFTNSFNRAIQYLVNRGYFVIAPNYRGSTGYGKAFHDANRFDLGGGDLQDVLAAAEWMLASGYIHPGKLAIMGGSYGGYMTAMAVTQAPELWAAGVAIVPFVNWFTEIAHEDPLLREYDLATMGDPETNRRLYEERSPIFYVDRIRCPLLVLAGAQDPRCPKDEAEQVVRAVRERGGVAELKIYEDEGHGFARVENQIDAYGRVAEFLDRYVAGRD